MQYDALQYNNYAISCFSSSYFIAADSFFEINPYVQRIIQWNYFGTASIFINCPNQISMLISKFSFTLGKYKKLMLEWNCDVMF